MIFIGVDNGVSGTISVVNGTGTRCVMHIKTPTFAEQSYTKAVKNISRINTVALEELLRKYTNYECMVTIERPMVNPGRFAATVSACRALEATLIVIERLKFKYRYIDSREWQTAMLPKGIFKTKKTKNGTQLVSPGPKILKKAAVDIARRMFPLVETQDADSILIAEYQRRRENGSL